MTLYGSFKSQDNKFRYELNIINSGVQKVIPVRMSANPFTLTYETPDNLLSPVRTSTAVVEVLANKANDFLFDFVPSEPNETAVFLRKSVGGEKQLAWFGFVTPNRYDNDYSSSSDVISFECRCPLSVLEDLPYISEKKETLYISQILYKVFNRVNAKGRIKNFYVHKTFALANDEAKGFADLRISERNFFDKKEDENQPDSEVAWSCKEVLEEVCKWLNLTAIIVGENIYLFDVEELQSNNYNFYRYSLLQRNDSELTYSVEDLQNLKENITITADLYGGTDNAISLDSGYNSVKAKDNFYKVSSLFEDAFDESKFIEKTSPLSKFYTPLYQGGRNYKTPNGNIINFALYGDFWYLHPPGDSADKFDGRGLRFANSGVMRIKKAVWFKFFESSATTLHRYFAQGDGDNIRYEKGKKINGIPQIYLTSLTALTCPNNDEFFEKYPGSKEASEELFAKRQVGATIVREYSKALDSELDEYIRKTTQVDNVEADKRNFQTLSAFYADSFNALTPYLNFDEKILLVVCDLRKSLTTRESYQNYPAITINRTIPSEIFTQSPNRYFRIGGEISMNNKRHDIVFNEDGGGGGIEGLEVDKIELEDLYIKARLCVGGEYWNGLYWVHQECDFNLYYGKREGLKCDEIAYKWHALKNIQRQWGQGLKDEGYYIPMPEAPQGDKFEFTIYLPDGRFREGKKYKVVPEKFKGLIKAGEAELDLPTVVGGDIWCYWLKNLKFEVVEANPNYLDEQKTDTEFYYNSSNDSAVKAETREFKICTDDGTSANYSSVSYLGANRVEKVDKIKAFASSADLRQEELFIHKFLAQYKTPGVRLKLELRLSDFNPFKVFKDSLHEGKEFLPQGAEIDVRRGVARFELREVTRFKKLMFEGGKYHVENKNDKRNDRGKKTKVRNLTEVGNLQIYK